MPWRVWILWFLFLVRGSFYCAMLPVWEGWDEYAHFAWVQHWLEKGTLPRLSDSVSAEIDESMRLASLPDELRWIGLPYLTHSDWWALPAAERAERLRLLRALPPALAHKPAAHRFDFAEAQQPPLYYWLISVPLRWISLWPLVWRVFVVRLLGVGMASAAIPMTWMAARHVVGDRLAVFCPALLAVAPGLVIDVSRVADDSLAIALTAILFWLLMRPRTPAWGLGVVLGAGLLAKAYSLALIPALAILWWRRRRDLSIALVAALGTGGWWYGRNLVMGYALSGWMVRASFEKMLPELFHINWLNTANVIAKSFLWFGAWSFLTLKSWMYSVVELGSLAGAVLAVKNRRAGLWVPAVLIGTLVLAMCYGSVVQGVAQDAPNVPGWYLWPMAGAIAVILVAGLRRYSIAMVVALAAMDMYGVAALLVPYYAGLVARNRADAGQFVAGLARLEIPGWLAVAWAGATVGTVVIAAMTNYGGEKSGGHRY